MQSAVEEIRVHRRRKARRDRAEAWKTREEVMAGFPHYFTVDECAQYLKKSRKFVEGLIHEGKLDAVNVGQGSFKSYLIPFESLVKFTGHLPLSMEEIGELILGSPEIRELVIQAVASRVSGNVLSVLSATINSLGGQPEGRENRLGVVK